MRWRRWESLKRAVGDWATGGDQAEEKAREPEGTEPGPAAASAAEDKQASAEQPSEVDETTEEADELRRAADLLDRLLEGVDFDALAHPIARVNQRTPFVSRFSPYDLGVQDGLARFPDGTGVTPPALAAIRAEHDERVEAIGLSQDQALLQAKALLKRSELAVDDARLRLSEALDRLAEHHPSGARAGFFSTAEEADAATVEARTRRANEEPEPPGAAAPAGSLHEPDTDEDSPRTAPQTPPREVQATDDQRVAASRELVWTLKQKWFWWGSAILFLAEFPFLRAVVRQLLIERNPHELLVLGSTISITVGFLIGTKLTGLLLRRAQSMFLLASLIHPTRRPALVRWVNGDEHDSTQPSSPTEQALRQGAWSRLVGALLLTGIMLFAVYSIAEYRSAAASNVQAIETGDSGGGQLGTQEPNEPASQPATKLSDQELLDLALSEIPLHLLQRVFIAVALLNLVGAITLAWASTAVPYTEVPAEGLPPSADTPGDDGDSQGGLNPTPRGGYWEESTARVPAEGRYTAEALEAEVLTCRRQFAEAQVQLKVAEEFLEGSERRTKMLVDLSMAQARLDDRAYWWANRAVRTITVPVEVDRELAGLREKGDG